MAQLIYASKRYTENPMLSLVVPVYNTPIHLLTRALQPFIDQSYGDMEVILVDDASNSLDHKELQALMERLKTSISLFRHNHNGGQNAARQTGVNNAKGRYIAFLDSDDYLDPYEFNKVLQTMHAVPADIYGYNYIYIDDTGNELFRHGMAMQKSEMLNKHEAVRKAAQLWPWIFARDLFHADSLYGEIPVGEDLVSVIPLLIRASSIYGINAYPYHYVCNPHSVMQTTSASDRLRITQGFDHLMAVLGPEEEEYQPEVEWQAIEHVLYWEPRHILREQGPFPRTDLQQIRNWMNRTFPRWCENRYLNTDSLAHETGFKLLVSGHYRIYRMINHLRHK
ncbi:Beta-1,3-N-acetylglucosaminyltransferase [Bifidobacterium pseudolongum subsp. globosum]|uniref:Beta-1,3-N-acetylglucosaminyltransferase n=1 Tax=Bifidobacterium pseudolongum subsp. globosum TaxID=1690 RepID=A0A4Q5AD17_9BIFI|nr:glycosyltransferase family 2 protein [Bifidobacterium pseudolongum]RYQ24147.1 Beta-1,3-N-acetylglucosaminyltransferase [Bifidobacterium pseudolongum subsp. globosum]